MSPLRTRPRADWELSGLTGPVRDLLVASAPGVIFVRTTDGLFRSDDGGTTWTALAAPPPLGRVTLDPANPRTLYAAGLGGLYKSVDDGVTWQLVLPLSDQQTESILSIAVSPAEPSLIYLAVAPVWPQPGRFRFLRSRDGGLSWDTIEERQQSSCAWSVRILYPHPSDATAVFRTAGRYASRNLEAPLELSGDQGASWSPCSAPVPSSRITLSAAPGSLPVSSTSPVTAMPGRAARRYSELTTARTGTRPYRSEVAEPFRAPSCRMLESAD